MARHHHADVVVLGTGMGGGVLAWALRDCGARVLLIERGSFLPREPENWDPVAVFGNNRYKTKEKWRNASGGWFSPGVHYFVGGNTKVYGAALPRLRQCDFEAIQHAGGISPAWPVAYDDLEPYYVQAERLFGVHGLPGVDPTDPPRSEPLPFPPLPADSYMEDLTARLRSQGLHPAPLPIAVDLREGGQCVRCGSCDGFPCRVDAKGDADVRAVRPALTSPNVELWTSGLATRITTNGDGTRVTGVDLLRSGERVHVEADYLVVACGAVNSAALLMRSANERHPSGLGNSSGLIGRHYMVHNNSVLVAIDPRRANDTDFQKTLVINDFYTGGTDPAFPFPMGNLQPIGKLQTAMMRGGAEHVPAWAVAAAASRSVDWWVMSEDLPDPSNRVTLDGSGNIIVDWRPNNLAAHDRLMVRARAMLRRAGFAIQQERRMGIETNSHQCGTVRFGRDPATSVLDPFCRAHDLDNLYVVDAGFFPSSAAVNPGLTIAAQALRVGEHLRHRLGVQPAIAKNAKGGFA